MHINLHSITCISDAFVSTHFKHGEENTLGHDNVDAVSRKKLQEPNKSNPSKKNTNCPCMPLL